MKEARVWGLRLRSLLILKNGVTTYCSELLLAEVFGLTHDKVDQVVVAHVFRVLNASFETKRNMLDLTGIVLEVESFLS